MSEYGACNGCGSAWFELAPPPEAIVDVEDDLTAVCIDPSGSVTGYAGVLRCVDCGELWGDPEILNAGERPRLFLVPHVEGEGDLGDLDEADVFDDLVAETEETVVLSFTQRPGYDLPEIDLTGGADPYDFNVALALALKGTVHMAMNAMGFDADFELEFDEEDDE